MSDFGAAFESLYPRLILRDLFGKLVVVAFVDFGALLKAAHADSDVDAIIAKFTPDGTDLVNATYLGGTSDDAVFGLETDGAGTAFLVGRTYSPDFPNTAYSRDR